LNERLKDTIQGYTRAWERGGELYPTLTVIDVILTSSRKPPSDELNGILFNLIRKYESMHMFRLSQERLAVALLCEKEACDKIIGGAIDEYRAIYPDAIIYFAITSPEEAKEALRDRNSGRLRYVNTEAPGALEEAETWGEDVVHLEEVAEMTYTLAVRHKWMLTVMSSLLSLAEAVKSKGYVRWDELVGERAYYSLADHVRDAISIENLWTLARTAEGEERITAIEDIFEIAAHAEHDHLSLLENGKRSQERYYDLLALRYVTLRGELGTPVSPFKVAEPT
jgi:hypothetical protein